MKIIAESDYIETNKNIEKQKNAVCSLKKITIVTNIQPSLSKKRKKSKLISEKKGEILQ